MGAVMARVRNLSHETGLKLPLATTGYDRISLTYKTPLHYLQTTLKQVFNNVSTLVTNLLKEMIQP